jgi:predicted transposase YbfD/YdcC
VDFPHLGQAFLILRAIVDRKSSEVSGGDFAFGLTSLASQEANPEQLLALARGHWEIENRSHYVRDTTYDEDRSQIRTRNGPRMMATLRNFAMSLLRLVGCENIASATRHCAASSRDTLRIIGY